MNIIEIDTEYKCRCCLKVNPETLFNLSEKFNDELSVSELYFDVTGVQVEEEDVIYSPEFHYICEPCMQMLETGYNVKKIALLANIHIQEVKKERKLEVMNFPIEQIEEKVAINGDIHIQQETMDDSDETVIFEILGKNSGNSEDADIKPEIVKEEVKKRRSRKTRKLSETSVNIDVKPEIVKKEDKDRKTRKSRHSFSIKYYSSSGESDTEDQPSTKIMNVAPEPGQCQHCQKYYPSKIQLDKHIKASHLKPRDFQCEFPSCGRFFQTKQHLEQHASNKHKPKRKTHECTYKTCRKSFSSPYHLKNHVNSVHLKLNKFKCKFCYIVYRNFPNLHQHCLKTHDYDLYIEKKKKQKKTNE